MINLMSRPTGTCNVDLARAFLMLQLPHPLLGHNINLGGVPRESALLKINDRAPGEDEKKDEHGDDRPGNLQSGGTFDLFRLRARAAPVLQDKHQNGGENRRTHERRQQHQKNVKRVHVRSAGRGPCGPQWKNYQTWR
jgi:hypothetical protein